MLSWQCTSKQACTLCMHCEVAVVLVTVAVVSKLEVQVIVYIYCPVRSSTDSTVMTSECQCIASA
jgi:hypothetical protein